MLKWVLLFLALTMLGALIGMNALNIGVMNGEVWNSGKPMLNAALNFEPLIFAKVLLIGFIIVSMFYFSRGIKNAE